MYSLHTVGEALAETASDRYHTAMDDVDIQDRIAALDALVPKEGAVIKLDQYGGGPDESRITANKNGYLRLGIELLKGAYLPAENQRIPVDLDYLTSNDSNVGFDWFERQRSQACRYMILHAAAWSSWHRSLDLLIFAFRMVGIKTVAGWVLK